MTRTNPEGDDLHPAFSEAHEWGDLLVFAVAFALLGIPASVIAGLLEDLGLPAIDGIGATIWALLYVGAAALIGRFRRRRLADFFATGAPARRFYAWACGVGVATLGVDYLQLLAMHALDLRVPAGDVGEGGFAAQLLAASLHGVVFAPLCEELVFRGALWSIVEERAGRAAAVVVTSLLFALAHGTLIKLPGTLLFGLFAAALRGRSGSVWPGVVAHALANGLLTAVVVGVWLVKGG